MSNAVLSTTTYKIEWCRNPYRICRSEQRIATLAPHETHRDFAGHVTDVPRLPAFRFFWSA
jgi:hypothetical protein